MGRQRTLRKQKKEKPVISELEDESALAELQKFAEHLGIAVRYEKGRFQSGGCRIKEKNTIILKRNDRTAQKIEILLNELSPYKSESFPLHSGLREQMYQIESQRQKTLTVAEEDL